MDDLISKLSEIRSKYNCLDEAEEPYYRALSEAIKVLSGQADGDAISRQAAIEAINNHFGFNIEEEYGSAVQEVINGLPSAQPEQRWIPCSERLPDHPENDDYYLVTIQCEHYDGWDDYVTGFAKWTKYGWDELSCYIGQIKVIAWMPLPEPYAEGWKE